MMTVMILKAVVEKDPLDCGTVFAINVRLFLSWLAPRFSFLAMVWLF